jgi:carbon monoxide dehydrogenase subunit G
MDFSGEYTIPADRETVWRGLNDADILKQCIDGCESLEWTGENELKAKVKTKVGPVSARFSGTVTLSEMQPPESYVITGQGQGGAAGFVKGSARVTLTEPEPGSTLLRYQSEAQVGGKLASVGGRLVKGVADKTADDFFRTFSELLAAAPAPAPAPAAELAEAAPQTEPSPAPSPEPERTPEPTAAPAPALAEPRPLPMARPPEAPPQQPMLFVLSLGNIARLIGALVAVVAVLVGVIWLIF